jgi:hypothetical protein
MPAALFSIARNAFTEAIRQPVFVVLLLGTQLLLVFNVTLAAYSFWEDDKLLVDLGLSTMFLAGLFLAAFSAAGVFGREIHDQTVLTVLSKPVGRPVFVLGKFLGVTGALAAAYAIWALVFMLSVRHGVLSAAWQEPDWPVIVFGLSAICLALGLATWGNYFYGWVFASGVTAAQLLFLLPACLLALCFDRQWHPQSPLKDIHVQLLIAVLLVLEALALLSAVVLAASTRLGQALTLGLGAGVFLLGLSSDYLFGRFAQDSFLAALGYAVLPNLQLFWLADALTQEHPVSGMYVLAVSGYGIIYTCAVLALGVALFQTREVG